MEPQNCTCLTGMRLHVKQEPESEFIDDDCIIVPEPSVIASDNSSQRIKIELVSEEELIERPCKKKKIITNKPGHKNTLTNGRIEDGRNGKLELTQLPCIVNIKPSAVLRRLSQENYNGTLDTSNEIPNTSLQSSTPEVILCESNDHVAFKEAARQNSSNNFTSKVYEILVDIQSSLKDLKAQVAENSKKIDELHKLVPLPCSWAGTKGDFNFPISTEEQLEELEKQLENCEIARKLVVHLNSRTYGTWKEMIPFTLKYMISGNVAVLYNLNGIKGSKKKFRDLSICNIIVECVQYKFKEATNQDILKKISLTLADMGARQKKEWAA